MRRTKAAVAVQHKAYMDYRDGWKVSRPFKGQYELSDGRIFDSCSFGYYKEGGRYYIALGFNGAIVGTAKTVNEVEEFISEFMVELEKLIRDGKINVSEELHLAKAKPSKGEWLEIERKIEEETGIDVSFSVRGGEVDLFLLVQYLRDNPDFNSALNRNMEINKAIKECFGAEVHGLLCKYIGEGELEKCS